MHYIFIIYQFEQCNISGAIAVRTLLLSSSADMWPKLVTFLRHTMICWSSYQHQQFTRISRCKHRYGIKGFLFSRTQILFPFKENNFSCFINHISHLKQLMYKVFLKSFVSHMWQADSKIMDYSWFVTSFQKCKILQ